MPVEQLSMDAALAGRDLALDRLAESLPDWVAYAKEFTRQYLEAHATLHVDELWQAGLLQPRESRALGVVVQHAIKAGWMAPTGEYRPSVHSHGAVKAVYRSQILGQRR